MASSVCTLTYEEEEEIKNVFMKYDVDENGMLELEELHKMFASFNVVVLKEDLKAFFEKVDKDQDGTVDYDELMQCIEEILIEQFSVDDVHDAFALIDEDDNGVVTHEEVATAMQKADVGIPPDDIIYILEEADLNRDGIISFSEFRGIVFNL